MAYDEELADRIRDLMDDNADLTEKKMFGGQAFLIGGKMAIAASGQGGVLVRVGLDEVDSILASTAAEPAVMRGREMNGWLRVDAKHLKTERELAKWVKIGKAAVAAAIEFEVLMTYVVDFETVSTVGLESSPFPDALAGLRANEARYYKNKYEHVFTVEPASKSAKTIKWIHKILKDERDLVIESTPLETTEFEVAGIHMAYVFYESGLSINVMYTIEDGGKRAVGFKLCDGMPVPDELAASFKFARQKSKLAGTIRGSYFVIKGEY